MSITNEPYEDLLAAFAHGLDRLQTRTTEIVDRQLALPPKPIQVLDSGKVKLTAEQVEKYLGTGGAVCPSCGSNDITAGECDVTEYGYAWQNISCNFCRLVWSDEYELTGVSHVKFAVQSERKEDKPIDS